jgi:hypothetical protein
MLSFQEFSEAAYVGNVGFQELVKFHSKATPAQKKQLQSHIQNKKHKEFRDLIHSVTGVQLHKSVNEKQECVLKQAQVNGVDQNLLPNIREKHLAKI